MSLTRLCALFAFVVINLVTTVHAQNQNFYWKGSYGRGVGVIPALECPAGKERGGGLCYDECKGDYDMNEAASLCMLDCPDGYADNGLVCHWKGSISYVPKSEWDNCKSRTKKSCTKIFGKKTCVGGDCIGGLVTDCRDGYKNVAGVCWYSHIPDGFKGTAIDPMKPSYVPKNPVAQHQVCRDNKILQAGLCYESCRSGYNGVGPVCWADTPKGYVDCFTGYAKSLSICASVMASQTMAVTLPVAMQTYAVWKAKQLAKVGKAGKAAPEVLEAGADLSKSILSKGDEIGKVAADVLAATAKGNSAQAASKVIDLLKFLTTPKVLGAMYRTGMTSVTAGMRPEDYWRTTSLEEGFARARDVASFIAVAVAIYNVTTVPPTPPVLNPLDVVEGVLDIMSAFMWTIYGQN